MFVGVTSRPDRGVNVDRNVRNERLAMLIVTVVTLAAFGPYLGHGIRTEQVANYTTAVIAAMLVVGRLRLSAGAVSVLVTYLVVLSTALLHVRVPVTQAIGFTPGSVLAGVDNLLTPVAVILVSQALVTSNMSRERLLNRVCRITVLAMCVNAGLAYLSQYVALTSFLSRFWDSGPQVGPSASVASRAAQLGRLTGTFNQPTEAGVMYGVALVAAVYLYRDHSSRLVLAGAFLTAGGVLTVSKVFILAALPVAAWQVLRISSQRVSRLLTIATVALIAAGAGQVGLLPQWTGSRYLARLVNPSGGVVDFYSAGRFGNTSTVSGVVHEVWRVSPVSGIGAAGLATAYDNAWVEGLVYAGIIGATGYTFVLVTLILTWNSRRNLLPLGELTLVAGVIAVVIAGSLGLPVLTGNRVATIVWMILGLTILPPPAGIWKESASSFGHDGRRRSTLSPARPMQATR